MKNMNGQNQINNNDSIGTRRRIKITSTQIKPGDENLAFTIQSVTEMSSEGDVITTETVVPQLVEGEVVNSSLGVVGKCQQVKCGKWLTKRTARYCIDCGKVICVKCARWDRLDMVWLCKSCRWKLRLKRSVKVLFVLPTLPFRKHRY